MCSYVVLHILESLIVETIRVVQLLLIETDWRVCLVRWAGPWFSVPVHDEPVQCSAVHCHAIRWMLRGGEGYELGCVCDRRGEEESNAVARQGQRQRRSLTSALPAATCAAALPLCVRVPAVPEPSERSLSARLLRHAEPTHASR